MENEYTNTTENPGYWNSVLIGGLIIGLILFIFGIISQYMTIRTDPTGASFSAAQGLGTFACFLSALGGFFAVRHYANEYDLSFKIGKGALIGLFAGIAGVLISTVLTLFWTNVIDPNLNEAFYQWQIANLEAQNLPEAQMEMSKQFIPEPGSTSAILWSVGFGLFAIGILNIISGIIGAKVFASEEE